VRWAEMLNDLRSDPRIRDHFQFWFFSYETGNPVPYSALLLRDALQEAVAALDPSGRNPSLHEMVVIGHSQGGLLTKMAAIDSGDRFWNAAFTKPPEELKISPESREMLKRSLFIKPVPSVKRLVFIATPHGGSYVAGNRISHYIASLVRLPGNLLRASSEVGKLDSETTPLASQGGFGSIYGMTPGSLLVKMLARTPIAEGVKAHSIIAVRGDGPIEPATTASWNTRARISRASSPSMSFAPDIRPKPIPTRSRRSGAFFSSTGRSPARRAGIAG